MFTCTLEHPVIGLDDVTSDHESLDSKILTHLICWTLGKVAAELPRQSIVKYCGIFATTWFSSQPEVMGFYGQIH